MAAKRGAVGKGTADGGGGPSGLQQGAKHAPPRRGTSLAMSASMPNMPSSSAAGDTSSSSAMNAGGNTVSEAHVPGNEKEGKVALKRQIAAAFGPKPIVGDIFGNSDTMLGMLYRSRVQEAIHLNKEKEADLETKTNDKDNKELGSSLASIDMFDRDSDSDDDQLDGMNPRQQLATTIKNWSTQPENDTYIINEGAVHALIALASMDDNHIKKCCAIALYYLSSRSGNRESLLSLGAASGIITISMQAKSWKIAKTCAQTLANLSMHVGGETSLAKDGAILACVILLGLKGNRLLPISMQALYNLTCSNDYYKGMERIVKAFLSLPALPPVLHHASSIFDTTLLFLKALRNSARYSWIRARLIEDGVVVALGAIAASLGQKEKDVVGEIVGLVAENMRLLSEYAVGRGEMIQKGALEILQQCMPYCVDSSRLQTIKALFNLSNSLVSMQAFEQATNIVASTAQSTYHPTILQYASACIAMFAADGCMRGVPELISMMVEQMPGLLQHREPLTQFNCVKATGHLMFFDAMIDQQGKEDLIVSLVHAGPGVTDEDAVIALTTALAKLTQDTFSAGILEKHMLQETVLDLLLKLVATHSNVVVQETCCIALTRIALSLSEASLTTQRRAALAQALFDQLDCPDLTNLSNTMSAVRAFGEKNICNEDLLKKPTLKRIAAIIANYGEDDPDLCRISCAVLAAFSYDQAAHAALTESSVLDVIFATTKTEDGLTREMVATTICNMSVDEAACRHMISKGVVEVLATLSGATSEIIQELCAKSFCNLTCTVDMHSVMIQNKVLQTILMIALVRSVASKTKQLCARAVLNLTSEENFAALKEAGAARVFAAISSSPTASVQHICAQGFLSFSATAARRDDLVTRRPVLQSLFNMVRCSSARSRILIGMTICNLLACPQSQKPAIHAGALSVFKLIATQDFEELKEASARTIISLGQSAGVYIYLTQHPLVPILVMILHNSRNYTFECTMCALACLAHTQMLRPLMISEGAVVGVVEAILAGRIYTPQCATEAVRCLYFLSYVQEKMEYMTIKCHVLLALHVLYRSSLLTFESAQMVALIIRNASETRGALPYIVSEGAFLLLRSILHCLHNKSVAISRSAVVTILNLSKSHALHESIVDQGCIEMLRCITLHERETTIQDSLVNAHLIDIGISCPDSPLALTNMDSLRISAACKQISMTETCREAMAVGRVVEVFRFLRNENVLDEDSRGEVAGALQHIASNKNCTALLVKQNSAELMLQISQESHRMETKSTCSTALGQISESTKVKEGTVKSLLMLTLEKEGEVGGDGGSLSEMAAALRSGIMGNRDSPEALLLNAAGTGKAAAIAPAQAHKPASPGDAVKSFRQMVHNGIVSGRVGQVIKTLRSGEGDAVVYQPDSPSMHAHADEALVAHNAAHDAAEHAAEEDHGKVRASLKKGLLGGVTSRIKDAVKKLTAFDMNSVDSIMRELEVFARTYDDWVYHNFSLSVSIESGGVVKKVVDGSTLALPTLLPSRIRPDRDRSSELIKIPFSMDPLDKDERIIVNFQSITAAQKEAEEREMQPQVDELGSYVDPHGRHRSSRRHSSKPESNLTPNSRRKQSLMIQRDMLVDLALLKTPIPMPVSAPAPAATPSSDAESDKPSAQDSSAKGKKKGPVVPAGAGAAWAGMSGVSVGKVSSPKQSR